MLVRDRYALTKQALESLYANTSGDWNLSIVDDGSADTRVIRLLREYSAKPNCSVLTVSNSGHTLSQLKNLGVAWSDQLFGRGDWLHVGDGDTCFMSGWLESMTNEAKSSEPDGFRLWGGQIHPFHKPIGWISYNGFSPGMSEHSVLDGPSWLMRWRTWDTFGPFDRLTAPGPCMSEEYPFCNDLIERRYRIGVIHPHVVIHTGLTHADGSDCVGRKEREAMIPHGVLAE